MAAPGGHHAEPPQQPRSDEREILGTHEHRTRARAGQRVAQADEGMARLIGLHPDREPIERGQRRVGLGQDDDFVEDPAQSGDRVADQRPAVERNRGLLAAQPQISNPIAATNLQPV